MQGVSVQLHRFIRCTADKNKLNLQPLASKSPTPFAKIPGKGRALTSGRISRGDVSILVTGPLSVCMYVARGNDAFVLLEEEC